MFVRPGKYDGMLGGESDIREAVLVFERPGSRGNICREVLGKD